MNTESTHPNSQSDSHHQTTQETSGGSEPKRVTLPEPDPDNITVLTNKLPNKPILPWNHYDSPWKEEEEGEETEVEATSEEVTQQEVIEAVETVPEAETPVIEIETEVPANGTNIESPESHLEESGDKGDLDEVDEVE